MPGCAMSGVLNSPRGYPAAGRERRRGPCVATNSDDELLRVAISYRALASWISRYSFVGDRGNSVIFTPRGARASATALPMAAGAVMELDSPTPLEPSSVKGDGDSMKPVAMGGASAAVGHR